MPVRSVCKKAIAALHPPPKAGHIGFRAGFVQENQTLGIQRGKQLKPELTLLLNVLALLFLGLKRFF